MSEQASTSGGKFKYLLIGILLGVTALYVFAVFHFSGRTAANTKVAGIDISDLSLAAAKAKLETAIVPIENKPITLAVGEKTFPIDPQSAGLSVNVPATVSQLEGKPWNPITLWQRAFGSVQLNPIVKTDLEKLDTAVAAIAKKVDVPPKEPKLVFVSGRAQLQMSKSGYLLGQDSTKRLLVKTFPTSPNPLILQYELVQPEVTDSQAQAYVPKAENEAASPITVTVGKQKGVIDPTDIRKALTYEVQSGKITPVIDGSVLVDSLESQIKGIGNTATDASFKIYKGKPYVVPSKPGTGINPAKIAKAILQVIDQPTPRSVELELGTTQPKFTTADAKALGITEQISTFTQHFPYAAYRVQNIGQAARYMNNKIVMPGEIYSMNETVRERTPENGYTIGYIIGPGGQFLKDYGGGVSTATTAMWSAAFFGNMERVEQRAHSVWIPRYRAGLEATVSWGSLDMRWLNTSGHPVLIKSYITNNSVTVTLFGTKTFDKVEAISGPWRNVTKFHTITSSIDGCEYQGGQDGFDITVTRVVTEAGQVTKRELFNTHYAPEPRVLCVKPSPSPSASQ
ncbi:MAG: VanW family protein [Actinomycetales bacterium]|nr:VanW family protein [Actinomycetales bacterium]